MLLFTLDEMRSFFEGCLKVDGGPDSKFGFGFDTVKRIVQTRGDQQRKHSEFTHHLLERRLPLLRAHFDA
jgi:hypothetical protein